MVRPFGMYFRTNDLFLFVDKLLIDSIDLSTATGLKDLTFRWRRKPQWVAMTLRTITRNHRNLQQISLNASWECYLGSMENKYDPAGVRNVIGETLYRAWLELDEVLVHLWELHSTRLEVVYITDSGMCSRKARRWMESLLSGAVARGIVRLVEWRDK
jgi:hypothetical protein